MGYLDKLRGMMTPNKIDSLIDYKQEILHMSVRPPCFSTMRGAKHPTRICDRCRLRCRLFKKCYGEWYPKWEEEMMDWATKQEKKNWGGMHL